MDESMPPAASRATPATSAVLRAPPSDARSAAARAQRYRASLVPPAAYPALLVGLALAVVGSILLAITVGSVAMPVDTVWSTVFHHLAWWDHSTPADKLSDAVIWTFRVPRALLAVVVGAGLAAAGTVLQAIVRNALADPYVLGVAQGGTFGAVIAIAVGTAAAGRLVLSGAAFAGAMLSLLVVLLLGRRRGRIDPTRLVLAGVAVGYLFMAGTSYIELRMSNGQSLAGVLFWLLGTVASASWEDLGVPTLVVLVTTAWLVLQARPLNALITGEESAIALGVDVHRFRRQLLVVASLLTGVVVAVAGGVGFVGLMIPHIARFLVGADHRRLLPVVVLLGALFLELVDIGARTLASPLELPLSVITAAIGAPFFLWLLRRSDSTTAVA